MEDPVDLEFAALGLREVIKVRNAVRNFSVKFLNVEFRSAKFFFLIINSGVYEGIMQPASSHSCTYEILIGFVDLIAQTDMFMRSVVPHANYTFMKHYLDKHLPDALQQSEKFNSIS
eukprot:GHVP01052681.1.p1 GENE.GHVP01052681.1~~GHVP01052681.1.p1  ORF type:complete len:128 (+),score=19.44 GHVP01052681.1:35-385(+)